MSVVGWATIKLRVFERDGWRCRLCGGSIDRSLRFTDPMAGQIDHLVPVVDGGSDDLLNLQAAHRACNQRKGPSRRRRERPPSERPSGAPIAFFPGVPDVDLTPRLAAAVAELAAAVVEQVVAALNGVPGPDRLLTVDDAAARLGLGRTAVYAEIAAGRLRTLKVGRRRLVPEAAIASFIAEGAVA